METLILFVDQLVDRICRERTNTPVWGHFANCALMHYPVQGELAGAGKALTGGCLHATSPPLGAFYRLLFRDRGYKNYSFDKKELF